MAETTVTISSIQFRCTFTAGYRPTQLAEAEPFIQYADRVLIFGGRDGQGRVEVPFDRGTGGGGGGGPSSTDALPEGTTNLYFTTARARASFSVGGALTYNTTTGQISYTPPTLAAVATSGAYGDLSGAPALSTVALTGSYTDLRNRPALATVATSGAYGDLSGRPALATVATSGSASDLATGTLPVGRFPTSGVAAGTYGSGSLIPVVTVDAAGRVTSVTTTANAGGGGGSGPSSTDALPEGTTNLYFTQARARAAISATGSLAYNASTGVISYTAPALAAVATSGAYGDLSGRPTLAAVATSGSASDLGAGTLPAARLPTSGATAGSYGSGSQIPVVTVDATGRITSVTTVANAGGGGGGASGTVTPSGTFTAGDVVGANSTDGNSIKSLGQPGPLVRGLLSGTAGVAFNTSTGAFSLAAPTTSVLGGVLSATASTNQFQTGINTSGAPTFAQPSFSNLSGSATAAQMPAFSGDATSAAGATVLTLAASGVTAGTYTAATVTVDAKGRVTSAANGPVAKQTVAFSCVGKPAAGEVLGMHVADVPFTVGANFASSQARALVAATASAAVTITRIPAGSTTETTIGTLAWAANATVPTFSTQAAVAFAVGDVMRCICPSTQDSTLADFAVSIYGAR